MNIKLSDHFSYGKLMKFTVPAVAMMIFASIYGVADGFFVSNFAGKTAVYFASAKQASTEKQSQKPALTVHRSL